MESERSPRFLGDPPVYHALLSDSAEQLSSGEYNASYAAFHLENSVGLRFIFLSKLNNTAWQHPVYASQLRSPSYHATLGSGWSPTFAAQDSHLPGPNRRFPSRHPSHDFPLLQASLAHFQHDRSTSDHRSLVSSSSGHSSSWETVVPHALTRLLASTASIKAAFCGST